MPRPRMRVPLDVYMNGRLVGRLRRQPSGAIDFKYEETWLAWQHALPVSLSLPLREDRYIGEPVIAVFDNLLPDSDEIRKRLAERAKADGSDAYSLLAAIGRDCVGALQFLPEGEEPAAAGAILADPLTGKDIARIISDLGTTPLGISPEEDFRISIAGAQEKTALLHWKRKWHRPRGTTATTHILKPSIGLRADGIDLSLSVENEHLCMVLAAAFGLPVAKTSMRRFGGRRVLIVERFDRVWTRDKRLLRMPLEDCCQALSVPPPHKYEADGGPGISRILDLLKGSDDPETDRRAFLKTQILFWLLGATDGHAKNFSLFLTEGGRFSLAPLYDILSAQPNVDAKQIRKGQMKLAMAVGDNRHYVIDEIVPRHFIQTASRGGMPQNAVREILFDLQSTAPAAIDKVLARLPEDFPQPLADSIIGGLRGRLRLLDHAR